MYELFYSVLKLQSNADLADLFYMKVSIIFQDFNITRNLFVTQDLS